MRLKLVISLLSVFAISAVVGCGSEKKPSSAEKPSKTEVGCKRLPAPKARKSPQLPKPTNRLSANKTYMATVMTSCGSFTIQLDAKRAPKTGGSFVDLVEKKFYDGLTFHRISPGFVIQGGDPTGTGTGGPGYSIRERPPRDLSYRKGTVAKAKRGDEPAGTSGSQFFVVTENAPELPPDYALLGKVVKGRSVVDRIAAADTADNERPIDPIVIERITITAR